MSPQNAFAILMQHTSGGRAVDATELREAIAAAVEYLDRRIESQLDLIFRHPDFRLLESSWRGLRYLVETQALHTTVIIRVLNLTRIELEASVRHIPHANTALWDQLVRGTYQIHGAVPYGCVVADYYFDEHDVDLLGRLGRICRSALAPMIAGWSTSVAEMDPDAASTLRVATDPTVSAAWERFRASDESRFVVLALPRVLGRDERRPGSGDRVWINAAFAMAANCGRSYDFLGHRFRIRGVESGGDFVPPACVRTAEGAGSDAKIDPVEFAMNDRDEMSLSKRGLSGVLCRRGVVCFVSAVTAHSVDKSSGTDRQRTAEDMLMSLLPYVLEWCLWARYLRCQLRDRINPSESAESRVGSLNDWLRGYIDGDPRRSDDGRTWPLTRSGVLLQTAGDPAEPYRLSLRIGISGLELPVDLVGSVESPEGECQGFKF